MHRPSPSPFLSCVPARLPARFLPVALLLVLVLPLAGCGWDDYEYDYDGNVIVQNFTDESIDPDDVIGFFLARFGEPWTGNLLVADILPGFSQFVGSFHEDYYDAEAEMLAGDLVPWYDVWIFGGEDNFFDIY